MLSNEYCKHLTVCTCNSALCAVCSRRDKYLAYNQCIYALFIDESMLCILYSKLSIAPPTCHVETNRLYFYFFFFFICLQFVSIVGSTYEKKNDDILSNAEQRLVAIIIFGWTKISTQTWCSIVVYFCLLWKC